MKISTRQIIIFYFIYSFAIKFLMLPHFLSTDAGRDGWITALLGSLLELLILFAVTRVLQKDTDIYQTLRKKTSTVGAKAILSVLLLFFILQILITLKQTSNLLETTLYEDLNPLSFAIPILILGVAFCYAPTRSIFRSGELFYILIIIALGLSILPAINKIDMAEVLPILNNGTNPLFSGIYKNLIYFESAAILLMFKGDIKIDKNFSKRFMFWAGIGAIVFVAFVFLYYTMFGPLTIARPLSIVNITQQSSYITQNGRLEWIIVCVWLILLLIRFGVTFFACFVALRHITQTKLQPAAIAFPLAILIYIIHAFVIVSLVDLHNFINALLPFILAFYIFVAVLSLTLILFCKDKKIQTTQQSQTKNNANNNPAPKKKVQNV